MDSKRNNWRKPPPSFRIKFLSKWAGSNQNFSCWHVSMNHFHPEQAFISAICGRVNIAKTKQWGKSLTFTLPARGPFLLLLLWFWFKWQPPCKCTTWALSQELLLEVKKEKGRTLIETPNKKEVDKIVGPFLLKGRRDGFVHLSFPVVPSISPHPPVGGYIFICLAQ